MINLKTAARWCGGTVLPEYEDICFLGAHVDSRQIQPGQLFVALKAGRDGHDFIPAALEKGAAGALGQRQLPGVPMIVVPDSLKALGDIARGYRRTLTNTRFIGLTGSVGKTTTKEMTACALSAVYRTQWTQANYNNDLGVPMTVLGLEPETERAVIEMGMNHFGEISYLTQIARPEVAVITNVGTMHIENLGSREGICKAKLEILEGLEPGGVAVLHGDEPLLRAAKLSCRTLFFGLGPDCHLRGSNLRTTPTGGTAFTVTGFGRSWEAELPVPGDHNVVNALGAILAANCVGVPVEAAIAGLADFRNTGDRLRTYEQEGYTVVADCYNAGPESMAAAFRVLAQLPTRGRRIAVLGDMLELGDFAPAAHRQVGEQAAEAADLVLAYGPLCRDLALGAGEKGRHFDTQEDTLAALKAAARPGDVLLFKGSHGMHMEKILERFFRE